MQLLQTLQASANNEHIASKFSWNALNREISADGSPTIDFDRFSQQYDQSPELQTLVDKFDRYGLTLKTHKKEPEQFTKEKESNLSKIAKRATKLGK